MIDKIIAILTESGLSVVVAPAVARRIDALYKARHREYGKLGGRPKIEGGTPKQIYYRQKKRESRLRLKEKK